MKSEEEIILTRNPRPQQPPLTKKAKKLIDRYSGKKNPEDSANIFSRTVLQWVSGLASLGNSVTFNQGHHPEISIADRLETNYSKVEQQFKSGQATITQAVFQAYKGLICWSVCIFFFKNLLDMTNII